MASDLVVPVVKIENVRTHPNADALELCDVLGYQVCIAKGKYKGGERVVYFPADTLIPAEWADKFGIRNFLKGADKDRVGKVRLRGEPSFGVVVEMPEGCDWNIGDNVAEYYGAGKYKPPVRVGCGDAAPYDEQIDPYLEKFTDIQNGRIFTDVFRDGEEVIVTEKIHGCFHKDSPVMLANGDERSISMLEKGMSVLTRNERTGQTEVRLIKRVIVTDRVRDDVWLKLTLENGREIICTQNHLLLTNNRGWVKACELTDEDDMAEIAL